MATTTRSQKTNNGPSRTRQRRRTEKDKFALLTFTVAALFAVSHTSAFNILQSPTTTPIRIDQQSYRTSGAPSPTVAATAPNRATTLLLVSPLDTHENNDNNEKAVSSSFGKRLHSWKCWIQFWKTNALQNLSRRRHARAARAVAASLVSAGSIASILGGAPAPAFARTLQETMEEGTQIYSLRPGVSREQAEQLSSGFMPDEVRDNIDSKSAIGATTGLSKEESAAKARQQDTLYGDYDDYDDDDYAADEEEFGDSAYGSNVSPAKQRQKSFSSETDVSNQISKGTKQSFTGISSDNSKTKPFSLYTKVSLACFVPTFGLFGVRDFVRNKREEANVKKAIEIVDAQRAEYFGIDKDGNNITATEEDSDIEDELKELKDGEDDDDDDEDDDDDDIDDEPPRRRRSLPKPPNGPQGDGSGGGGFDDFDDDDDGPSDEDIARLGDIFNKS